MSRVSDIVSRCRSYSDEQDWFDFKENKFDIDDLGEYISALSNAAIMAGEPFGYMIWGVHDKTHEITGTTVRYQQDIKNEPVEHYLSRNVTPAI